MICMKVELAPASFEQEVSFSQFLREGHRCLFLKEIRFSFLGISFLNIDSITLWIFLNFL